ncbi:MAG: TlpA disulfide reductase family protein [Saprospiraceae bacterium]
MKYINYIFLFLLILLEMACEEKPKDYYAAISSCASYQIKTKDLGTITITPYDKCMLGTRLPDFEGVSMEGKTIDKSYFRGKVTVINLWHIGCGPCVAEIPGLNKLVEKYNTEDVNFLAISRNTTNEMLNFLSCHPYNFDQIVYGLPIITSNFKYKGSYPLTIVMDEYSTILYAHSGGRVDSTAIDDVQLALTPVIDKVLGGK